MNSTEYMKCYINGRKDNCAIDTNILTITKFNKDTTSNNVIISVLKNYDVLK